MVQLRRRKPVAFKEFLMTPVSEHSLTLVSPGKWHLGTLMVCEKLPSAEVPVDAVASWEDGGSTYCFRPQTTPSADYSRPEGDSSTGLIHQAGPSAVAWLIGESTIVKVRSWVEGVQSEAEVIAFVREKAPSVPVPEVIHEWVDPAWNRSYLVEKRVPGVQLDEAWPRLSPAQRQQLTDEVVGYCIELARFTSDRFETVSGKGVNNCTLCGETDLFIEKMWAPDVHGPFTMDELAAAITIEHAYPVPPLGDRTLFYHGDLTPGNIFVTVPETADGEEPTAHVSALIDWEQSGYYPAFWISTCPEVCSGRVWGSPLSEALTKAGFRNEIDWYMDCMRVEGGHLTNQNAVNAARDARMEAEIEAYIARVGR